MKYLLILALTLAPAAHAAYKCKDERGLTHIGDTPPVGCANVVMYEITSSGTILRTIPPTPTEEQLKVRLEEAARRKEEEKAAAEQRRKDVALLATYSSEKDFDTSRDLNLQPIELRIKGAQERSQAVAERRKELEAEMEFYDAGKRKGSTKARAAPPQLVADLDRTKKELDSLEKSVSSYQKEMTQVRERYETDKKRWVELKQMHREGKLDLRDPKEIEAAKKTGGAPQQQGRKYNIYIVPTR